MRAVAFALLAGAAACSADDPGDYVLWAEEQMRLEFPEHIDADGFVITRSMLSRGDSVFHGQLSRGTCATCHGNDARGGPIAADLNDNMWRYNDGTYEALLHVIREGVPHHDPPMPPLGGAALSEEEVAAVAGYVYWLSRRHGGAPWRVMPPAPDQPVAAQRTEAQQPDVPEPEPEPADTLHEIPEPAPMDTVPPAADG